MTKVTRIQAGQYSVDDGRHIVKQGSGWFILDSSGRHEFGPVTTLNSAKSYVENGTVSIGQHNLASKHGRRQSKKEFNSYLAAEVKNGNPGPAILYFVVLIAICALAFWARGH